MADFDPYLKWLGIRDPQRPPNHYRLLGLEMFEGDPDVINSAADRQMLHVRTHQNGPHGEESQTLLSELAVARRCLLTNDRRAEYDAKLRAEELSAASESAKSVSRSELPPMAQPVFQSPQINDKSDHVLDSDSQFVSDTTDSLRHQRANLDQKQLWWTMGAWASGGLAAMAVGSLIVVMVLRSPPENDSNTDEQVAQSNSNFDANLWETTPQDGTSGAGLDISASPSRSVSSDRTLPSSSGSPESTVASPPVSTSNSKPETNVGVGEESIPMSDTSSPQTASNLPTSDQNSDPLLENEESASSQENIPMENGEMAVIDPSTSTETPMTTDSEVSESNDPFAPTDLTDALAGNTSLTDTEKPQPKSLVPSITELKKAEDELAKEFEVLIRNSGNSSSSLRKLGERLLSESSNADTGSAKQFSLLSKSVELLAGQGRVADAVQGLKQLNEVFEIDYWNKVQKVMLVSSQNLQSADAAEFKTTFDEIVQEAIDAQQFEKANDLIDFGIRFASNASDRKLVEEYQGIRRLIRDYEKMVKQNLKYVAVLEAEPNNARANEFRGDYFLVVENDQSQAVEFWAKSDDSKALKVAKLELASEDAKNTPDMLLQRARAWVSLGKSKPDLVEIRCLQQAIELYRKAIPYLNESKKADSKTELDALVQRLAEM